MVYTDFKDKIEDQLQIKYWAIKHLILIKIRSMMDINMELLQWSIIYLIKKTSGGAIKNENMPNK